MPREKLVEKYLCKKVRDKGALCLKLVMMGKRNFPDRTILHKSGQIFFVELKVPGKVPKHGQAWFKDLLLRLGFNYYVATTEAEIDEILKKEMGS